MKKLISYLIIISLVVGIIPLPAFATTNPGEIDIELKQPTIPPSVYEDVKVILPQSGSVIDWVYGNSKYYHELKRQGKLHLLGTDIGKLSVQDKVYQGEKESVTDKVYQESDDLQQIYSSLTPDNAWYNTLVGPSTMNGVDEKKYSAWSDLNEIISPETGNLTLKYTDISLPGRNGLDLTIKRLFQSNQSILGDRRLDEDGTGYNDYSTYYYNRYALGIGWSFGFPSVQIEKDGEATELYYHPGNGAVYRVNFTADETDSNLERYYQKDAVFDLDTSFSSGEQSSAYVFQTADQTREYFAADGRLLAIVDRFNNQITFNHQEQPVANYAPNHDFRHPETYGVCPT